MNFKPYGNRIVVKRHDRNNTTKTGIILPDTAGATEANSGDIVAIGDEVSKDVELGDSVMFGKYAGSEINIDEEQYLIINFEDVLGKVLR